MYWIDILKAEVEKTTQADVARKLKLSKATISQALSGTYAGKTDRIKEKVLLEFENKQVNCPIMGSISFKVCRLTQAKEFNSNNMNAVRQYKACMKCKNNVRVKIC